MWKYLPLVLVLSVVPQAVGQPSPKEQSAGAACNQAPPRPQSDDKAVPRGPGDSSSRDTKTEIDSEAPDDSVSEFHPWDPHKAQKDVEVGDFYFKRQSYYQAYLKILPSGPFAAQTGKALERIKMQAERPEKHLAQQEGCEPPGKAAKFSPEPLNPDRPALTRRPTSPASGKSQ